LRISRKKHIIILILIGIVFFFGVGAALYPMIGSLYSMSRSQSTIRSYQSSVGAMESGDKEQRLEKARSYNKKLAEGIIDDELSAALAGENEIMCYVDVPKLGIYIPVFYGTGDEALNRGCGWVEHTSLPIGGESTHAVISGHTGMPDAEMFTRLDESEEGDSFYIHVLGDVLEYRIDSIVTVDPNDVFPLEITDKGDHVTLVTCTPYGINNKRLLVRGTRVVTAPEAPAEESSADSVPFNSAEDKRVDEGLQKRINDSLLIIVLIITAAAALYAAACVWLSSMLKKASAAAESEKQQSEDNNGEEKEK